MDERKQIDIDEECPSCKATGLYIGMGENDGAAVVCHTCNGTGRHHYTHVYTEFSERKPPTKTIERVFEGNPGIGIGNGDRFKLGSFGGMPFEAWDRGCSFPPKSEMRAYSCPGWWYQTVNYKLKPDWEECWSNIGRGFSACKSFPEKDQCWARFDADHEEGQR